MTDLRAACSELARSVPRFSIEGCECSAGIARIFGGSSECWQCSTQFCRCASRYLSFLPCCYWLRTSYSRLFYQNCCRLSLENSLRCIGENLTGCSDLKLVSTNRYSRSEQPLQATSYCQGPNYWNSST